MILLLPNLDIARVDHPRQIYSSLESSCGVLVC